MSERIRRQTRTLLGSPHSVSNPVEYETNTQTYRDRYGLRIFYHSDNNNNPPSAVSFLPIISSTSVRLHSEIIRLFFLQTHRETDLFFASSGVQITQQNRGLFHFRRTAFTTNLKS
jgi:hypothetical protein